MSDWLNNVQFQAYLQICFFLICLSDFGEYSKFKQTNQLLVVPDVFTILLLSVFGNSLE